MTEYLMIGEVLKPQGIRGECKIKSWAADIGRYRCWKTLYLKDGSAFTPVEYKLVRIRDGFVYAHLNGSATAEDAERLRGRELYISRADAEPAEENSNLIADLIGCDAVDENGVTVGTLREVLQNGPVDTWVFSTPRGTLMAPALLAVFPAVDPAARRISVLSEKLMEVAVLED